MTRGRLLPSKAGLACGGRGSGAAPAMHPPPLPPSSSRRGRAVATATAAAGPAHFRGARRALCSPGTRHRTGEGGAGLTWRGARAAAGSLATCFLLRLGVCSEPKWGPGDQGGSSEGLLPGSCWFRGQNGGPRTQVRGAGSARGGGDLPWICLRLIRHIRCPGS